MKRPLKFRVRAGDYLENKSDGNGGCLSVSRVRRVRRDLQDGLLYVRCLVGKHFLEGQMADRREWARVRR